MANELNMNSERVHKITHLSSRTRSNVKIFQSGFEGLIEETIIWDLKNFLVAVEGKSYKQSLNVKIQGAKWSMSLNSNPATSGRIMITCSSKAKGGSGKGRHFSVKATIQGHGQLKKKIYDSTVGSSEKKRNDTFSIEKGVFLPFLLDEGSLLIEFTFTVFDKKTVTSGSGTSLENGKPKKMRSVRHWFSSLFRHSSSSDRNGESRSLQKKAEGPEGTGSLLEEPPQKREDMKTSANIVSMSGVAKTREEVYRNQNQVRLGFPFWPKQDMRYVAPNSRPYGLPMEMSEERQEKIWNVILGRVFDLESIINLRETCKMFRNLLGEKYIAAMLPQAIWNHFENSPTTGRKEWLQTLATLREVSKSSKTTVDTLLQSGLPYMFRKSEWLPVNVFKIPKDVSVLHVGAKEIGKREFWKVYDSIWNPSSTSLPLPLKTRTLILDEIREDGACVGPKDDYCSFMLMLETFGHQFTSFHYITKKRSSETYRLLSWWVKSMPNLQELVIDLQGPTILKPEERTGKVDLPSFPKLRNLKRYAEGGNGFGVPYLKEILVANPTVQEVILGDTPPFEWRNIKKVMDPLEQLTAFQTSCIPKDPLFFKGPFQLAEQLKTLVLWEEDDSLGEWEIPAEYLFRLLTNMKSLMELKVSMPCLQRSDGARGWGNVEVNLPKLERLTWKVFPTFRNLAFLKSAEGLREIDLDLRKCPADIKDVTVFLGGWSIPRIFPGLEYIRAKTEEGGVFNVIWRKRQA